MEEIRFVESEIIAEAVEKLFLDAVTVLPCRVVSDIRSARDRESSPTGRDVLSTLLENLDAAKTCDVPVCQDTGMAVVFADVGRRVHVVGSSLENAVNDGVRRAYAGGALRLSVVEDPLYGRKNTGDNTPAVVHIRTFAGENDDRIILTAAPKGFGSENMSALSMMTPSANEDDVVAFVLDTVKRAGANPCPPIYVGVGIGGDFELCALLAKRALLRETPSPSDNYARLEKRLLREINALGIGPQGFGGDTTCLGVFAEYSPTHIAGLPVAVNINCHVCRHVTAII